MSNQTLRLQLVMDAANRMAAPLRAVTGDSKVTAKSLADTKKRIKELEQQSGQIDGYRTLGRQIGVTRSELATAQQTAQKLGREMSATQNPTKAMVREFQRAKAAVKELSNKEREMVAKHGQMKSAMNAAGISTKQLSSHQRRLRADLQAANAQLDRQRQKLEQTAQRQKKFASISKTYDSTMASRGKIAGYGAAAMATGAAGLYKASNIGGKAMAFDAEMSKVQALTRLKKDSQDLSALRSQARELGANTAYTAMEAAQGQGFLAMAGFTPKAIKAAMPGVLDLAKAGGAEIAEAADIGSNILTGFKLPAEQMGRLGDVMVGTFTRANVDLRMLGETMKYAGPVAAGLNVDLETSAAMAGKLGDAGIQGSMGGTALRAIMGRLAAPPKAAADALNSLGIKTKDAKGNLRELPDILTELHKKTAKLGDATRSGLFKHIAGEEAYAALSVLTDQAGTGKLQELIAILRKTKGEASATAKIMADNALGDLDNLTSALDDLGIQAMETEQGPLRGVIQSITGITQSVGVWMRQNPELASTIARVAVFTAAAAAGGGALLLVTAGLLGPLAAMRMGFSMLFAIASPILPLLKALTLGFARAGIAMMTTPIGWLLAGIALIAGAVYLIYKNWDTLVPWFKSVWDQCKGPVLAFWNVLKEVFSWTPIGLLTSHWGAIWSFFDTLPEGAMNKGRAIVSGLIDGITAKWRDLMDAVKNLTKYLPDWVTGGGVTISQESVSGPSYLTGNSGGGLAMAGGGGYAPTMYTPKPLARSTANSSVSVSAPIYIQQQPGQSATSVAQEVSRQLDDRERRARAASRASLGDTH
ncbi:phage tail tape measure protein [Plesiomonas shigelloides]|uniref:phage tail tape measure protein n=1 Tax=Plesiomonas shigelloides TaxID=703 RepID=UPI00057AAC04|nr:phage tail tape measure protein [Plesiomonas shigelloides]